jgi:hypothetical protein
MRAFPNGVVGHIVSMTLRHATEETFSVATCECGWKCDVPQDDWLKQDQAIDEHWAIAVSEGAQVR